MGSTLVAWLPSHTRLSGLDASSDKGRRAWPTWLSLPAWPPWPGRPCGRTVESFWGLRSEEWQLRSLGELMSLIGHPAIEAAAEKQNMALESKESRLSMAISHQRFGAATTRRVRAKFMRNFTNGGAGPAQWGTGLHGGQPAAAAFDCHSSITAKPQPFLSRPLKRSIRRLFVSILEILYTMISPGFRVGQNSLTKPELVDSQPPKSHRGQ